MVATREPVRDSDTGLYVWPDIGDDLGMHLTTITLLVLLANDLTGWWESLGRHAPRPNVNDVFVDRAEV
eukprot:6648953-Lingulodinium_polyedra.AAC.1